MGYLQVNGVLEHLPIAVAILGLGVALVVGVLKALDKFKALVKEAVTAGVQVHELAKHNPEAECALKERISGVEKQLADLNSALRDALEEFREELRQLRDRFDRHIDRRRNPDDSRP